MSMWYPLTKGLLVSMAMRSAHDFMFNFTPDHCHEIPGWAVPQGFTDTQRVDLLIEMHEVYKAIVSGKATQEVKNSGLGEEVYGDGFYHPDREGYYLPSWPKNFNPNWINGDTQADKQGEESST